MDNNKLTYVSAMRQVATELCQLLARVDALQKTWDDRGYGAAGINPLVQENIMDSNGAPLTVAEASAAVAGFDQIMKFVRGNAAASAGQYLRDFNRIRQDM